MKKHLGNVRSIIQHFTCLSLSARHAPSVYLSLWKAAVIYVRTLGFLGPIKTLSIFPEIRLHIPHKATPQKSSEPGDIKSWPS